MKPWLKGGLIASGIDLVLILIILPDVLTNEFGGILLFFTQPISMILFMILTDPLADYSIEFVAGFVLIGGLLSYFAVGAFIGWLIGRRRSKKR